MTDLNNKTQEGNLIKDNLIYCFKKKLKDFWENIPLENKEDININNAEPGSFDYQTNNLNDEKLENPFENSN